jgi:hypothetical protein
MFTEPDEPPTEPAEPVFLEPEEPDHPTFAEPSEPVSEPVEWRTLTSSLEPVEPPQEPEPSAALAVPASPGEMTPARILDFGKALVAKASQDIGVLSRSDVQHALKAGTDWLADNVRDERSMQEAVDFAGYGQTLNRLAHDHHDPLVERTRQPYQDRLDERKAVTSATEYPQLKLTSSTRENPGAVTRYLAERKRIAKEKADEEQRQKDAEAKRQRDAAEAERLAAEKARREAAEAVEREKAEQARLLREAQEAHERGEREKVEEAKRLAQESAARVNAAREQVAQASAAAVAAEEKRDNVVTEVVKTEDPAANLTGAQSKKRWTWEYTLPDTLAKLEIVKALAYGLNVRVVIAQIKQIDGWQTAEGHEIVALLEHLVLEHEARHHVTPALLLVDTKYLNSHVKNNGDTLKLPAIRIYDAGQVAVGGRGKKASS